MSDDAKTFFDKLFSIEGDIFGDCVVDWAEMRETIIRGFFKSVQKLEGFIRLEAPPQVLFEVADVKATTAKMSINLDWMDMVLGEIANKKEYLSLLRE